MKTTVEITGIQEVRELFAKIEDNAKKLEAFFKSAGLVMVESVNRNFMAGGRPDAWKPLRPSTIKRRRGAGSPEPLRDTGILMASIGNPGAGGIFEMVQNGLEVGTNIPYAAVHQWGAKNIPARPFMMFQPDDADILAKLAADHAMEGTA